MLRQSALVQQQHMSADCHMRHAQCLLEAQVPAGSVCAAAEIIDLVPPNVLQQAPTTSQHSSRSVVTQAAWTSLRPVSCRTLLC